MAEDYYDLLGVSRTVSDEDLKKAYRKKALEFHPDRNPGDKKAEENFKKVSEAYDVLKDPQKRATYDQYGHKAFQGGGGAGSGYAGGHDPFDIFNQVFSRFSGNSGGGFEEFFGGGKRRASNVRRGADLRYDLEVTLEQAAQGVEKEIEYKRLVSCKDCKGTGAEEGSTRGKCTVCQGAGSVNVSQGFFQVRQTCPRCNGDGSILEKPCKRCHGECRVAERSKIKIQIPRGVSDGDQLRSVGGGEAGTNGGATGDLYVVVQVKAHEFFERQGADLYCNVPIQFTLAALGGTVEVPTLTGNASIKIPAGTQNETTFRLKEHGMPRLQSERKGDQLVRVTIQVPKKLTHEQRQKLEDFAIACGDAENPVSEGFFQKLKKTFE